MENTPIEIFFEERIGSNGIKCLDYKNESDIKYIREDNVIEITKALKDKILFLEKENKKLSLGYDDWHNLYCKTKESNVLFAEWIANSDWVLTDFKENLWMDRSDEKLGTLISTSDLFMLFLNYEPIK